MKNNLENTFREQLRDYEVPYDPQAWEALETKLDAKTTGGGSSSAFKWIVASAVITTAAVVSFVFINSLEENAVAEKATVNQTDVLKNKGTSEDNNNDRDNNSENSSLTQENSQENTVETEIDIEKTVGSNKNNVDNKGEINSTPLIVKEQPNESVVPSDIQSNDKQDEPEYLREKENYIAGNISAKEVCRGESITITNTGAKNELVRFEMDNKIVILKKAHSYEITPENNLVINFVNSDNKIVDSEYIRVNELPSPDFTFEANIFEEGLPVVYFESYGDYEELEWKFEDNTVIKGKEGKHHLFEQGEQEIALTVKDFNGCVSTVKKELRIDEKYNLMAVDAFTPNGSDTRKTTFMPFALTERDVQFTLTIVDPRDNSVIFTSKEVSNPWTGKDMRTGKMTPPETVYIWKVQIQNPLPNERPVYVGTVVHD